MAKFDFLKRLPNLTPAANSAERRAMIEAEEKAALIAEGKLMPEIQGTGTSRAQPKEIIIDEADVLSPKLNNIDMPLNADQQKMNKYKAALAALGAGGAGALAINLNNTFGENPPAQAASAPVIETPVVPEPVIEKPVEQISEQEKVAQKMIANLSRPTSSEIVKPLAQDIDFGQDNTMAHAQGLKDAQRSRDISQLINSLGKAADIAGSGMSGTKAQFGGVFDDNIKGAEKNVTDFQDQVKFEKEDPNSAVSNGYRKLAASMGFNIKGNASASDLERLMPQLANIYNQKNAQYERAQIAKDNRESRRDEMEMRLAAMKEMKALDKQTKSDAKQEKYIDDTKKALDSGTLQKIKGNYNTAKRMESAIDEFSKNPTGYSDYATLMGGLKVLQGDESVVREAEIRLGMNAGSLKDKVNNYIQQVTSGKSLQPGQRKAIIETVKVMANTAKKQYLNEVAPHVVSAKRRNLPLNELFNDDVLTDLAPPASSGKTVIKKGYNAKTNKTQLIYSDGTKEIVDGRR